MWCAVYIIGEAPYAIKQKSHRYRTKEKAAGVILVTEREVTGLFSRTAASRTKLCGLTDGVGNCELSMILAYKEKNYGWPHWRGSHWITFFWSLYEYCWYRPRTGWHVFCVLKVQGCSQATIIKFSQ